MKCFVFWMILKNIMPYDKPRYLMGVGTPADILGAVKRGVDMFDCVMPTRSGRTGLAFTWKGRINIKNNKFKNDNEPLDPNCSNLNLNKYSKNYLNHLFNTNEILGSTLLTLHNINFYQELMSSIRENIKKGTFDKFTMNTLISCNLNICNLSCYGINNCFFGNKNYSS